MPTSTRSKPLVFLSASLPTWPSYRVNIWIKGTSVGAVGKLLFRGTGMLGEPEAAEDELAKVLGGGEAAPAPVPEPEPEPESQTEPPESSPEPQTEPSESSPEPHTESPEPAPVPDTESSQPEPPTDEPEPRPGV